jgi:hypothetical protein
MDRRRVFKLLMMGRITAAEAERLMAEWEANRESMWILAGCIGIGLAAVLNAGALPEIEHMVHALRVTEWMHGALAGVMRFETSLRG